jgi:hypothetical protein
VATASGHQYGHDGFGAAEFPPFDVLAEVGQELLLNHRIRAHLMLQFRPRPAPRVCEQDEAQRVAYEARHLSGQNRVRRDAHERGFRVQGVFASAASRASCSFATRVRPSLIKSMRTLMLTYFLPKSCELLGVALDCLEMPDVGVQNRQEIGKVSLVLCQARNAPRSAQPIVAQFLLGGPVTSQPPTWTVHSRATNRHDRDSPAAECVRQVRRRSKLRMPC